MSRRLDWPSEPGAGRLLVKPHISTTKAVAGPTSMQTAGHVLEQGQETNTTGGRQWSTSKDYLRGDSIATCVGITVLPRTNLEPHWYQRP